MSKPPLLGSVKISGQDVTYPVRNFLASFERFVKHFGLTRIYKSIPNKFYSPE